MLFQTKPLLYFQLLDKSFRYLAIHPKDKTIMDQGDIVFDTQILEDNKIVNTSLLETRIDLLVKEKQWKNAKAHILLMDSFVVIREETVPAMLNESEVRDYLALHLNGSIRMPFENPVFDFEIFEKNEEEQKITLIAYPGEYINQYQRILEKANLKPEVADLTTLSLYRIAEKQGMLKTDEETYTLILQWNAYHLNMGVYHQDRPTFLRNAYSEHLADSWNLEKSGDWVWQRSQEELELVLDEQLDGVERFLDFYRFSVLNGDNQISEIILNGYYPDLEYLKEKIATRFELNVQILKLPKEISHAYAPLYGLSLKDTKRKDPKPKKEKKRKIRRGAK